ncbi:DUF3791 domain-containing protein [Phocaeicola sp.]|uniref:DUF3791 domain-containing protein n=1 Tax=Phocaeicola sp. TaxID=2773926 RepID=UPI00263542B1|nr:DUF3791 domain-containing protein [Phocaeicola sp.]
MEERTIENHKIHFAIMAIETSAKKMNISPMEMYRRLERVNLFKRLVWDCYDVMHTQSLQHVAEDLVEALHNWEMREKLQTNNES